MTTGMPASSSSCLDSTSLSSVRPARRAASTIPAVVMPFHPPGAGVWDFTESSNSRWRCQHVARAVGGYLGPFVLNLSKYERAVGH